MEKYSFWLRKKPGKLAEFFLLLCGHPLMMTTMMYTFDQQRPQLLGIKTEMGLAQLMRENKSLLKFGINLEVRCARVHVNEYLQRNNDNCKRLHSGFSCVVLLWDTREFLLSHRHNCLEAGGEIIRTVLCCFIGLSTL